MFESSRGSRMDASRKMNLNQLLSVRKSKSCTIKQTWRKQRRNTNTLSSRLCLRHSVCGSLPSWATHWWQWKGKTPRKYSPAEPDSGQSSSGGGRLIFCLNTDPAALSLIPGSLCITCSCVRLKRLSCEPSKQKPWWPSGGRGVKLICVWMWLQKQSMLCSLQVHAFQFGSDRTSWMESKTSLTTK